MVIRSVYPHFLAFNLGKSFPTIWCERCDFRTCEMRNIYILHLLVAAWPTRGTVMLDRRWCSLIQFYAITSDNEFYKKIYMFLM